MIAGCNHHVMPIETNSPGARRSDGSSVDRGLVQKAAVAAVVNVSRFMPRTIGRDADTD